MTLTAIIAGALLTTAVQPSGPEPTVGMKFGRYYQWYVVPGGGVCPVPTPFAIIIPLSKAQQAYLRQSSTNRNEIHIVIQSEKYHTLSNTFTQAVIEGMKQVVEHAREVEEHTLATAASPGKKADPKTVIDPVLTGF